MKSQTFGETSPHGTHHVVGMPDIKDTKTKPLAIILVAQTTAKKFLAVLDHRQEKSSACKHLNGEVSAEPMHQSYLLDELKEITSELLSSKRIDEKLDAARKLISAYQNFKHSSEYQDAGKIFEEFNKYANIENKLSAVIAMKLVAGGLDDHFNLQDSTPFSDQENQKIWSNYFKSITKHPEFFKQIAPSPKNSRIQKLLKLASVPFEDKGLSLDVLEECKQLLNEINNSYQSNNKEDTQPNTTRIASLQDSTSNRSVFSSPSNSTRILERNKNPRDTIEDHVEFEENNNGQKFLKLATAARHAIFQVRLNIGVIPPQIKGD